MVILRGWMVVLKNSYNGLYTINSAMKGRTYLRECVYSGRPAYYIGFTIATLYWFVWIASHCVAVI